MDLYHQKSRHLVIFPLAEAIGDQLIWDEETYAHGARLVVIKAL